MNTIPLDTLSDDDRVLLHLAGELPPGAAADPQAAPALRAAWASLDGVLTADAAATPVAPAGPAVRAVLTAMRQPKPAAAAARRKRVWRPPGWILYPTAAAAAIALAMVGWWYKVHDELYASIPPEPPLLVLPGHPDVDPSELEDDNDLVRQFNSMIVDRGGGMSLEPQFAALNYLESVTR